MPTYVYQCLDCEETFEVRASIREKEAGLTPPCPRCGASHVQQRITGAFVLGSGHGSGAAAAPWGGCGGGGSGPGCCG